MGVKILKYLVLKPSYGSYWTVYLWKVEWYFWIQIISYTTTDHPACIFIKKYGILSEITVYISEIWYERNYSQQWPVYRIKY